VKIKQGPTETTLLSPLQLNNLNEDDGFTAHG